MKKTGRKTAVAKQSRVPASIRSGSKDRASAKSGVTRSNSIARSPATETGSAGARDFPNAVYQDDGRS